MVLYKRKPFSLIPPPAKVLDTAEVYVMRGTGEVFTEYSEYLKRLDYLLQKKFVDSVNGRSGLSYFDALESETRSATAIENIFPEVLKDPILRKVQFSTISRIDDLVNSVYDDFKRDFFPGEEVVVTLDEGEQLEGAVREKAKFPMIRGPDGTVQRAAFSRYFVRLDSDETHEALVDDKHLRRDKRIFTKQNLRAFLKHSLQREAWIGAPWLVKEHLAIQYRLPMEIPSHLLQDARLLANKVDSHVPFADYLRFHFPDSHADVLQQQILQMKPPKGRRSTSGKNMSPEEFARQSQEMAIRHLQQQHPGMQPQQLANYHHPIASRESRPLPPPPIKYPIEDLDLPPKNNGVTRPQLNFFTPEMVEYIHGGRATLITGLNMRSMGMLLEVWNTLNVQCEVYAIDSFTFDDFADAMNHHETDPTCELLEEVYCAVLKLLVDEKGNLLPAKGMLDHVVESEESSDESQDKSELSTPQPDAPALSTRSRVSHVDPNVHNPRSPSTPAIQHRAAEMLGGRSWIDRLAARDMAEGGWQVILIGLLHHMSHMSVFKSRCEKILAELAPMEVEPTQQTAVDQFAKLDINLRISALQMITVLSVGTSAIRDFLDLCSEDMTEVRKRKIDHQRAKKLCAEGLTIKDRERKILWPANMPDSPKQLSVEPMADADIDDTHETNGAGSSDAEEETSTAGRALRRASDRKRKRESEAARREKEKAEKTAAAKEHSKQSKEFKKILHDIEQLKKQIMEHEENIAECDRDLREANVQRTKVLGKDRFCNRYYWFERNGQPFAGLPNSSTASYGFANGRIWVQGPDEMESTGFIERTPEEQNEYQARFRMTVPERRRLEEGTTVLKSAHEWGFIDNPDRLDNLIGWLDDRGEREKKLRKELCDWRDLIVQYMEAHKHWKEAEAARKLEADEEQATRITTRHKTQEDVTAARERCLKWTNSMAKSNLGHIHSRPPPPTTKTKGSKLKLEMKQPKGVAVPLNRQGKPVTRQGASKAVANNKKTADAPKPAKTDKTTTTTTRKGSMTSEERLMSYYVV